MRSAKRLALRHLTTDGMMCLPPLTPDAFRYFFSPRKHGIAGARHFEQTHELDCEYVVGCQNCTPKKILLYLGRSVKDGKVEQPVSDRIARIRVPKLHIIK